MPSEGYFQDYFEEIKGAFEAKIPFIAQIMDFFEAISNSTYNAEPPDFSIQLPGGKWGTGSHQIIDWTAYAPYRNTIADFIKFIAWFMFLKHLWRRSPKLFES